MKTQTLPTNLTSSRYSIKKVSMLCYIPWSVTMIVITPTIKSSWIRMIHFSHRIFSTILSQYSSRKAVCMKNQKKKIKVTLLKMHALLVSSQLRLRRMFYKFLFSSFYSYCYYSCLFAHFIAVFCIRVCSAHCRKFIATHVKCERVMPSSLPSDYPDDDDAKPMSAKNIRCQSQETR